MIPLIASFCVQNENFVVAQSDSSRQEGPMVSLRHTLQVEQSAAKGAAWCCQRVLLRVGRVVHQG